MAFNEKGIIGLLVMLVIAGSLGPTINSYFTTLQNNTTGAAATLYGLGPLFLALLIVIVGVWYKFSNRR